MMIELDDAARELPEAPGAAPVLDDTERARIAAWIRGELGTWTGARDLARLADIALEPGVGLPGGVAVLKRVVHFDPSGSPGLTEARLVLGVSTVLLTDFLTTFALADIEPFAAVLFARA